jgi:predicted helicase
MSAIDVVAFVAPRRGKINIVQATGRAMRKASPDKEYDYILMPLFLEREKGEMLNKEMPVYLSYSGYLRYSVPVRE